jgi:hypothetical protein
MMMMIIIMGYAAVVRSIKDIHLKGAVHINNAKESVPTSQKT